MVYLDMVGANTKKHASGCLVLLQAFYILSAILEYILSYVKPPKPLLAYLQCPLLPKVSSIIMHLS